MSSSGAPISEFLDIDLLASLPDVELRARYLVSGYYAGMHKSPFRGNNAEFKEHRKYIHGDSITAIDWKVYARTDRLHVRLYEEDTDLSTAIFIDASRSMDFQERGSVMSKWDYAASIAAACMLFMYNQKDEFTLSTIGETQDRYLKPSGTLPHFTKMLERLRTRPEALDCLMPEALADAAGAIRSGTIVILISDFYADAEAFTSVFDQLQGKNCEIVLFHVLDHAERFFPYRETMLLQDSETGEKRVLSPAVIRKEYLANLERHTNSLNEAAKSRGGDYVLFSTDRVPLEALSTYLAVRNRRGRRFR